jgi:hypothetical protein
MAPRKSQAAIVDSAASTGNASIETVEGIAITSENTPAVALALPIAPDADTTPILTSAAIDAARASVASLTAAMALLGESHAAYAAMSDQLDVANGVLALAIADAEIDAEKNAAIASAHAAATAAKLPDDVLAVMLAAIEAKYAPVPAPAAPALELPAAPYVGRKPIGPRTADRNAQALAAADADPTVYTRAAATHNAFRKDWSGDLRGVSAVAGTRYVSIAAFAGDGVANKSDYLALVPVLRRYLLSVGLKDGGESAATDAWLFGFGPHAAGAPKGADTLALKFIHSAGVALHSDGRFRLTPYGVAGVRFVSSDAAALAAWNGSTQAASTPTQAASTDAPAPAATPRVPTPPAAQALPNGGIASTARCQHCTARNFTTNTECSACGVADWQAA